MAKAKEKLIKLACEVCGRVNYWSHKNKKAIRERLNLKKHCKWCQKHTAHKETK
jgi:large subunit ribosomal protein L33